MELFITSLILLSEYLGFIAFFALFLLGIKFLLKDRIKDFVWRKLMHLIAFFSIIPLTLYQNNYLVSLIVCAMLLVLEVCSLLIFERFAWFKKLLVEKYPYEVLISLTLFYLSVGVSIYLGWGLYNLLYIPLCAVIVTGLGDASGALIGIPFGKHKVQGKLIDGTKSIEGSIAILLVSFIVTFILLIILNIYPWYYALLVGLSLGVASTIVELFTKFNLDNITITLVNTGLLMMFSLIL